MPIVVACIFFFFVFAYLQYLWQGWVNGHFAPGFGHAALVILGSVLPAIPLLVVGRWGFKFRGR